MKNLIIKKQDKRTGQRPVGRKFQASDAAAKIWLKQGIVEEVNAPKAKPKAKKTKKK